MAGHRLSSHDDRLWIRRAGHVTSGLPAPDPARPRDGAGSGRHVGVRAPRRPGARDPDLDGSGRAGDARSAGWPGPRPVLGERSVAGRCRDAPGAGSIAATPAARPVGGGGDPRDTSGRLPADRRRSAKAPSIRPEPARPGRLARVAREARLRDSAIDLEVLERIVGSSYAAVTGGIQAGRTGPGAWAAWGRRSRLWAQIAHQARC